MKCLLARNKTTLRTKGLVPGHFAYLLEGAAFARLQSWAWKEVNAPVKHY